MDEVWLQRRDSGQRFDSSALVVVDGYSPCIEFSNASMRLLISFTVLPRFQTRRMSVATACLSQVDPGKRLENSLLALTCPFMSSNRDSSCPKTVSTQSIN